MNEQRIMTFESTDRAGTKRRSWMMVMVPAVVLVTCFALFRVFFSSPSIVGTWVIDGMDYNGQHYTCDEMSSMAGTDLSAVAYHFEEDGRLLVTFADGAVEGSWYESGEDTYVATSGASLLDSGSATTFYLTDGRLSSSDDISTIHFRKV